MNVHNEVEQTMMYINKSIAGYGKKTRTVPIPRHSSY